MIGFFKGLLSKKFLLTLSTIAFLLGNERWTEAVAVVIAYITGNVASEWANKPETAGTITTSTASTTTIEPVEPVDPTLPEE